MKILYKQVLSVVLILLSVLSLEAQVAEKLRALEVKASYIGDVTGNVDGGLRDGATYLGLINLNAKLNTEKAGWWSGGEFFANIANTHGGNPSEEFVGDFQGVINEEAGFHTYLYELWYKQRVGNVFFTAGLQDLNVNLITSDNACMFINSSFGTPSTIADNIPSNIFPLTALGLDLQWQISEKSTLQAALFDGTPDNFSQNPYNIEWKLSHSDGFMLFGEYRLKRSFFSGLDASFRLGTYYHQAVNADSGIKRNGGLYLIADQEFTNSLSGFAQLSISPNSVNANNRYLGLGITLKEFSDKKPDDKIGLALACACFDNLYINETTFELTYHLHFNKHIFVQPDIQYVVNPFGTGVKLKNALVVNLRLGMSI